MQRAVHHPGPEAPGVPGFTLDVPAEWSAHEAPGAVLAVSRRNGDGGAAVVVTTTRIDRGVGLRDVAVRSFAEHRRTHPGIVIDDQRVGRFGERVVYLRGMTVPDARSPVAQVQALCFAPGGPERTTTDVVALTGSCPAAEIDEHGGVFVDMIASLSFTDGSPWNDEGPTG